MEVLLEMVYEVVTEGSRRAEVLHGARQSGKTTLARQVAAERGGTYTTLDDEQTRLAALEDPLTVHGAWTQASGP